MCTCFKVYFSVLLKSESMLYGYALEVNIDSGQCVSLSSSAAAIEKAVQEDHSPRICMSQENTVPSLSWTGQDKKLFLDILALQIEKKYIRDQVIWEVCSNYITLENKLSELKYCIMKNMNEGYVISEKKCSCLFDVIRESLKTACLRIPLQATIWNSCINNSFPGLNPLASSRYFVQLNNLCCLTSERIGLSIHLWPPNCLFNERKLDVLR